MLKKIIFWVSAIFLTVQVCAIPTATVDDAQAALDQLRVEVNNGLNVAFLNYTVWAKQVDALSVDTKSGAADEVAGCVDTQANEALEFIHSTIVSLAKTFLNKIYVEEEKIVVCGGADEACLDDVVTEVNANVASVMDEINAVIENDKGTIDQQLTAIGACAA